MALTGSSFAMAAGDSEAVAEAATDEALEGAVGMLGLAMLGALPVPWTGGILNGVDLGIAYEEDELTKKMIVCTVKRGYSSRQSIYVCNEAIDEMPAALWITHIYTRGTW